MPENIIKVIDVYYELLEIAVRASCYGVDIRLIQGDEEVEGLCLSTRFDFDTPGSTIEINCHSRTEIEWKQIPPGITATVIRLLTDSFHDKVLCKLDR